MFFNSIQFNDIMRQIIERFRYVTVRSKGPISSVATTGNKVIHISVRARSQDREWRKPYCAAGKKKSILVSWSISCFVTHFSKSLDINELIEIWR